MLRVFFTERFYCMLKVIGRMTWDSSYIKEEINDCFN